MRNALRFLRSHWRWMLTILTLLFVALSLRSLSRSIRGEGELVSLGIESDPRIDLTPAQITSIRKIGKWEFLSVQMEEIVDTTHRRFLLPDEQLVRIYRGTIRLGIDMGQLPDSWLETRGDTAILRLPPIRRLDRDFIDEGATQTFFESGMWDNRARSQLYHQARRRMERRFASSQAPAQAERNGREQVTALMRALGFTTVEVSFGNVSVAK
ncbi:MAG: DUF4230 domain-containing protein [Bacteroidaceae bacterium]|nr:DUF4230 domain-containing protein [Bacteroidaceae bacterium]MBR1788816.1 DUF4230 domain-containing protein [Bacteroidaceae bacterium]